MGQLVVNPATGASSTPLGVSVGVTELFYEILTPATLGRLYGTTRPKRAFQQGWVGVGYAAGGGFIAYVGYATYIDYESADFRSQAGWFADADTLFWDLQPGCSLYIEVDW